MWLDVNFSEIFSVTKPTLQTVEVSKFILVLVILKNIIIIFFQALIDQQEEIHYPLCCLCWCFSTTPLTMQIKSKSSFYFIGQNIELELIINNGNRVKINSFVVQLVQVR